MCYDIKFKKETQVQVAQDRANDEDNIEEIIASIEEQLPNDYYHISGFAHPKLLIYTNENPTHPTASYWGLIPSWVKDNEQKAKLWNNTLNARGESIFEKPSFRSSAKDKRCLIYLDGFYEHHHHKGGTYPYHIVRKDKTSMCLAGLWSEWVDQETGELLNTFSIVTTEGNEMMAKIHNNPKLSGPRMPVILPSELADNWLTPINDELDKVKITELLQPYDQEELDSFTVRKLRGKGAVGNVPEANDAFHYDELNVQGSLF